MHNNNIDWIEWYKNFSFFLWTTINDLIVSGQVTLRAENSGNQRSVGASPAGEAHSAPQTPIAGWRGLTAPSLRTPPPLSAFGLDFRPFEPHSVASRNSLRSPQCLEVWIKHRRADYFERSLSASEIKPTFLLVAYFCFNIRFFSFIAWLNRTWSELKLPIVDGVSRFASCVRGSLLVNMGLQLMPDIATESEVKSLFKFLLESLPSTNKLIFALM